ncbi:hypothetical protein VTK56DRAFT_1342 [Thermocarpiscus australiensis]
MYCTSICTCMTTFPTGRDGEEQGSVRKPRVRTGDLESFGTWMQMEARERGGCHTWPSDINGRLAFLQDALRKWFWAGFGCSPSLSERGRSWTDESRPLPNSWNSGMEGTYVYCVEMRIAASRRSQVQRLIRPILATILHAKGTPPQIRPRTTPPHVPL